jgi:hypothetical protein
MRFINEQIVREAEACVDEFSHPGTCIYPNPGRLDYSQPSLRLVDQFIETARPRFQEESGFDETWLETIGNDHQPRWQKVRRDELPPKWAAIITKFSAYVGEIHRRRSTANALNWMSYADFISIAGAELIGDTDSFARGHFLVRQDSRGLHDNFLPFQFTMKAFVTDHELYFLPKPYEAK